MDDYIDLEPLIRHAFLHGYGEYEGFEGAARAVEDHLEGVREEDVIKMANLNAENYALHKTIKRMADKVAIANGHHNLPDIPNIPDLNGFEEKDWLPKPRR